MYRIFIVEDDEIIARTVKGHLETMSDELRKSTIFFLRVEKSWKKETRKNFSRIRRQIGYGSFYKLLLTGVERIKNGHTNKKVGGMS